VTLDPPDFIEKAAEREGWDEIDLKEWMVLRRKLEGLRSERLTLYGPTLIAAWGTWPFTRGSTHLNESLPTPTLEAVRRLVHQLQPPPIGTEASQLRGNGLA
jgi:hypothetical protein